MVVAVVKGGSGYWLVIIFMIDLFIMRVILVVGGMMEVLVGMVVMVGVVVSISSIFPLLNHSTRIFYLDITNDAKKSLKPLGHMRPVGSVPQVKIDGPWNQKMYV